MKVRNLFSNLFKKNKREKDIISSFNEEEISFLRKINGLKADSLSQDKKDLVSRLIEAEVVVKANYYEKLDYFTVATLQTILSSANLSKTGKKSELIERIRTNISEADLSNNSVLVPDMYILSSLGKKAIESLDSVK